MPALDYIVIILFALMILIAGLAFSGSGSSMKSYFAAGGALPWWLSGLSLFMSFFSAGTFVVWGSIAYEYGWVAITIQWMMALGGFFIGFYIAPKWRKMGVLTVGEYLGNRFGMPLKQFYSYLFLLLSFVTTGAFLYPVAKLFNVSSGISVETSIVAIGILVIAYTTAGGLWAVVITDVLQFVILSAGLIIVVPLAFQQIGGPSQFIELAPDGFFDLTNGEYTIGFMFAFLFYNTIFIGGNWAYVQRYTSVSSEKDAKKVAWLFGTLYLISPVLWMIPPMIFRELEGGNLAGLDNEGAFFLICKRVLPTGMLGLMLGGMIFATASSVTTTLNMSAAVFTNDIVRKFKRTISDRNLMRTARISTVVLGILTIGVALLVPRLGGIVEVVLSVGAITAAPLFAPPIWALFSNRQTSFSIITATLLGLGINCFFKFLSPLLLHVSLDRANEMLVGVLVPLMILGIFEILLPASQAHAQAPEQAEQPMESQSDAQNILALKVMGITLISTGLLIIGLGIFAPSSQIIVIFTGLVVTTPGILLLRKYHIRKNN
jgi:SSS family solute:Na+ symporter